MSNFNIVPVNSKKLKPYMPYIIIGGIAGIFFYFVYRRNSSQVASTDTSTDTSGADISGLLNTVNAQNQQQVQNVIDQLTQQMQEITAQQQQIDEQQNEAFASGLTSLQDQLNQQLSPQNKSLSDVLTQFHNEMTQQKNNYSSSIQSISENFNKTMQEFSSNFSSQLTDTINQLKTQTTIPAPTPTPTVDPYTNEIKYLENLRKTSQNQGTRSWANQTQYLLNLAKSNADQGTKNWAINQLTTKQGVSTQQLRSLGVIP